MAGSSRQATQRLTFPRRGEVYLVVFDPALGHEIKKTRPALVIQNDVGNEFSSTTIVAAITSRLSERAYPIEVVVEPGRSGLQMASTVRLDQIRTVDKSRLIRRLGATDTPTLQRVDRAIQISLGLIPL
jgi:mRNA interferase MazF